MPISKIKAGGINDDAVTTAKIVDGTVAAVDIADGAVTSAKLGNDSVTNAKIDAGAVDTTELADGAVTSAKLDTNIDISNDLTVDNTVGIGTVTSPEGILHTAGSGDQTVKFQAGGEMKLELKIDGNTDGCSIRFSDGDAASRGQIRYQHSTDAFVFYTNGNSEKLRIPSSGGITFNGDTAAANALDDYEEGTSQVSVNGITASTNTVSMNYVKVGSLVHIIGEVLISGKSANSGNANFALPFAPSGTYSFSSTVGGTIHYNTIASSIDYFGLYGGNASVYGNDATGTFTNNYVHSSNWTDGRIGFTLTYTTF